MGNLFPGFRSRIYLVEFMAEFTVSLARTIVERVVFEPCKLGSILW